MDIKQEISDIPRALRETLEKGRPEYDALVRHTRWGDGPLYILASGASFFAGLTGAYAFEYLLGWPVVVRGPGAFRAYALSVLRPRSVVLLVSHSGESDDLIEAAQIARRRGVLVLVMTNYPSSALARMADGVFLLRTGEEHVSGMKAVVCQQAGLSYVGLVAARALTRHSPQLDVLDEEFRELPKHAEWVLTQLSDAARSLASELQGLRHISVAGGGFYHPPALQWSRALRELAGLRAEGFAATDLSHSSLPVLSDDDGVAFLSGSRCRVKKELRQLLEAVAKTRAKTFSVTDRDDSLLADRSGFGILLPVLTEMVGSTLTLVLLDCVTYHLVRERSRGQDKAAALPGPRSRMGPMSHGKA